MPIPSVYSNVSTHVNRVLTILCFFNVNLKTLHSAGDVRRGSARKFFTFSRKIFRGGPSGRTRGEGFEIQAFRTITYLFYQNEYASPSPWQDEEQNCPFYSPSLTLRQRLLCRHPCHLPERRYAVLDRTVSCQELFGFS